MGFHICEYCPQGSFGRNQGFPLASSADTTFDLGEDGVFITNDLVPHYIETHGYCPPRNFVEAIEKHYEFLMRGESKPVTRMQSKDITKGVMTPAETRTPERVGYLTGKAEFEVYDLPEGFAKRLWDVLEMAREGWLSQANRTQYRGLTFNG